MKPAYRMYVLPLRRIIVLTCLTLLILIGIVLGSIFIARQAGTPPTQALEMAFTDAIPVLSLSAPNRGISSSTLVALLFSDSLPVLAQSVPVKASETPAPRPFSAKNATPITASGGHPGQIEISNNTNYKIDIPALLDQSTDITCNGTAPTVLIVHTHTSEAYTPTPKFNYAPTDSDRTQDPNFNVVRVGRELKQVLEERGIQVVHDERINDYPSYNGAYKKTLAALEEDLLAHPSVSVVIDLHRDSLIREDGTELCPVWEANGTRAAQAMLVLGSDQSGMEHPFWRENLALGLKIQEEMLTCYPNLARPLNLAKHRYNGHVSTGEFILEMGAGGNTLEEALCGVRYFGECLANVILRESQKNT